MPRIACLLVPQFPIAAACRADPDLAGRPLVLAETSAPHARVLAASRDARAAGVRVGHTLAQARAVAAGLTVRRRDPAADRSAAQALGDVAASVSDRVEVVADGAVFLDAGGVRHLAASERGLATALVARAAKVGLEARAGLGASMIVARLAALHAADGVDVVPAGTERGFMAPLPIACLAPDAAIVATLERWGVRRLGDLARLPLAEVATRLGPAGAALVRTARGEDARPLAPQTRADRVEEMMGLEYALDALEPLLFVLRGLLERIVARVGLAGVGCARLGLAFDLDDRGRDVRDVSLAAPTRDVRTLLGCLRVELEARPPRAAITRVLVHAVAETVRALQLGLFTPPGPSPERLATTLARLAVLCGADRVGTPAVADTHRPGSAATTPFTPPPGDALPAADAAPGRLVVRAFRPPRPIEVFSNRGRPDFVRGVGLGGRVVGVAGPWRLAGEWWGATAYARDYWDLQLSDGGVYRCYRDGASEQWFVDGVYD
jgi:protein ImuB